jgi:hypothetical protein
MNKHELFISRIQETLATYPYVNAIVLIGSCANTNLSRFDEYSDVEIIVFVTPGSRVIGDSDIQNINDWLNNDVLFIYFKDIAGWVGVTKDGLRFEIKFTEPNDKNFFLTNLHGPIPGGYQILSKKPGFVIPLAPSPNYVLTTKDEILYQVKDFYYMLLHASQHLQRKEIFITRKVIEIHLQKILLVLTKNLFYKNDLIYPPDDRLELKVDSQHLTFLSDLCTHYDFIDIVKALTKSVEHLDFLIIELNKIKTYDLGKEYLYIKNSIYPLINKNLELCFEQ